MFLGQVTRNKDLSGKQLTDANYKETTVPALEQTLEQKGQWTILERKKAVCV